jgi:uncharacterized protein (TIGR02246 family)
MTTTTDETREREIDAIRKLIADLDRYQTEVDGFEELLHEDVEFINFVGRRVRGKSTLSAIRAEALRTPMARVLGSHQLEEARFPRPDIALVTCTKSVSDEREPETAATELPAKGWLNMVLTKEDDRWLVLSYQVTPIPA